jgi:hypothetical protein
VLVRQLLALGNVLLGLALANPGEMRIRVQHRRAPGAPREGKPEQQNDSAPHQSHPFTISSAFRISILPHSVGQESSRRMIM